MATPFQDTSIGRTGRWLVRLPSWLAAIALFLLMTMTFADVVLRSSINSPILAATEMTRIFMGIVVFASLPAVSAQGGHIVVDLFDGFFSEFASRIRDGLVNLVSGVLLFWPASKVYELAIREWNYGTVTEYLHIPQVYMSMFIAIFTALTALVMIGRGIYILVWGNPGEHRMAG